MTIQGAGPSGLATDLKISVLFCTRLPLAHAAPIESHDVARASWAFPIVGALLGGASALVYWSAAQLGLPPAPAAALAVTTTLLATGCLHEDGLADTADGLGGGRDRAHKLEIMRDSRLGTYGASALAMSLLLRWSALTAIGNPASVALALIAAHAAARATLPAVMRIVPPARPDGLSARVGRPPSESAATAGVLGTIVLWLALGPAATMIGVALLVLAAVLMAWMSERQIGGLTGDVLGALEQVNEMVILLTATALLKAQP
jgi:adenosylcobinamide-GDP ribazoletransferase